MCDTLGVLTDSYALIGKTGPQSKRSAATEYSPRIHDERRSAHLSLIPQAR
jgi:hypothetical protein